MCFLLMLKNSNFLGDVSTEYYDYIKILLIFIVDGIMKLQKFLILIAHLILHIGNIL